MKNEINKYVLFLASLMPVFVLVLGGIEVDAEDTWVVKSKNPVFTLWMTGKITRGEPDQATQHSTDTITLDGTQYSSASRWFTRGNAVYCPWSRKPIVYVLEAEGGGYKVGLSAKNYASHNPDWTKPTGYNTFKVAVYVDNKHKGMLFINASDTEINTEYLTIENVEPGEHNIKFLWTNDKYNPGRKQDANIEIHNVTFEKIN